MIMATRSDLWAIASGEINNCSLRWFSDPAKSTACRGYPMYTNQDNAGCGRQNTGDRPRLEDGGCLGENDKWNQDTIGLANCVCAAKINERN
jgi:hypothetical protein